MPERYNEAFWSKIDQLVAQSDVIIDRPKDSAHPNYHDHIYPFDYGYLAGTTSSDGAGIDIWRGDRGTHEVVAVLCTVDMLKKDAELKILLGCTDAEMLQIAEFTNSDEMGAFLIRRELSQPE